MSRKKDLYLYGRPEDEERKQKIIRVAVILVLVLVIAVSLLSLILASRKKETLDRFTKALQEENYSEAMDVYYEVQGKATDQSLSEEERNPARGTQIKIENIVDGIIQEYLSKIDTGQDLNAEEKMRVQSLSFLSSMHINPYLKAKTEALLDGDLTVEAWSKILRNFVDLPNMKKYVEELYDQKDALLDKIEQFQRAGQLENGSNWQLTWAAWDELRSDQEGSRFAREYASYRLLAYQEREYSNLMNLTARMMKAEQYYTAQKLLKNMYEFYPDREELSQRLAACEDKLPDVVEAWSDDVLSLALNPLVVREDLAFAKSSESAYAYSSLISAGEFKKLLDILYAQDYVLVSASQIRDWPERRVELMVPANKKPLILIFDNWQYNVLNQVCGTVNRLFIQDQRLIAEAGDIQGEALDAIQILSDFIKTHPDFSFDGAKALINLNLSQSIFGYCLSPEQNENLIKAWKRVGAIYPEMTEEEFAEHRYLCDDLMNYLLEYGWEFSCSGYHNYHSSSLTPEELQGEIQAFQDFMSPWLADTRFFVFPEGSHVYGKDELEKLIISENFRVFFSQGPKPYRFATRSYKHFDSIHLNAYNLSAAEAYLPFNILSGEDILDRALRAE